jgi:hypothetical protein
MDELTDWLKSLTVPQLRALACQAGIKSWRIQTVASLTESCRQHAKVVDIYEEHFGS